jgi:shikimate kinase
MLIFLVGYAGCGKSSLGKLLARRLGNSYVDTDKLVEKREGATIADIFYYQGEEYFRHAEREVLEQLFVESFNGVVATGGGLAIWQDNMERMNVSGVTVYLRRSPEKIISRLSDYGREKRPMFRGKNDAELLEFMTRHMAEREPYYSQSQLILECDGMSDDEAVEMIVNYINK